MAERVKKEVDSDGETPEVAPAPAAASKGGFKQLIPLIVTLLLMPAVAWAMTQYVLLPKLKQSMGIASAHDTGAAPANEAEGGGHSEKAAGEKGGKGAEGKQTIVMSKLLVNVSGTLGSRYLLASLTISGSKLDFKARIEKLEAKLRDAACTVLATKTISDLEKPGARNLVRSELLTAFNNILGGSTVEEMYITEFAIQ